MDTAMSIRNSLASFVGLVITKTLGETNLRKFVSSVIKSDLDLRCDDISEWVSEHLDGLNIDRDTVAERAAEKVADNLSAEDIAEEVRESIKGDLDADTIRDDIHTEIKDDIDVDDLRSDIAKEIQDGIDMDDLVKDVRREIIDGIDTDFEDLVATNIEEKICPDNVATMVADNLSEKGNFSECVKREVIEILARQFAESHSEDFKSAVRALKQSAQSVLTASQEILGEAASQAADAAIDLGEVIEKIAECTSQEDFAVELKRKEDALKIATYNEALALSNATSEVYSKQLAQVKTLQESARQSENEMSDAYGRLIAAQNEVIAAGLDIRLVCKNTM